MTECNYLAMVATIVFLKLDLNEKSNASIEHLANCKSIAESGDYARLVKFLGLSKHLKPNNEQHSMLLVPNYSCGHKNMKPHSLPLMCTRCLKPFHWGR